MLNALKWILTILFVEKTTKNFVTAEQNLYWWIRFDQMNQTEYAHLDSYSVATDPTLSEVRKENRLFPIILKKGKPLLFHVNCVMDDYNKNTSSGNPRLRTTFKNNKKPEYTMSFEDEDNHQAAWETKFKISENDVGKQTISCDYKQGFFSDSLELEFRIFDEQITVDASSYCKNRCDVDTNIEIVFAGGEELALLPIFAVDRVKLQLSKFLGIGVERIKQEKSQLKANTTIDIISSNVFHNQSQIDNKIVLERKCGCLPSTTSTTTTTTSTTTATISTTTTPTSSVFTMTLFLSYLYIYLKSYIYIFIYLIYI